MKVLNPPSNVLKFDSLRQRSEANSSIPVVRLRRQPETGGHGINSLLFRKAVILLPQTFGRISRPQRPIP